MATEHNEGCYKQTPGCECGLDTRRDAPPSTHVSGDRIMAWVPSPGKLTVRTEPHLTGFGESAIVFQRWGTKSGFIADLMTLRDQIDRIIAS